MAATKIRSRWVEGLLEFFGITSGTTVLKIAEDGIEANVTGDVTGNVTGSLLGNLKSVAISKNADYALSNAEKQNQVFVLTATDASKTFTLGLASGSSAIVYNAGDTNAFTVKNIADDTGTSLAAGEAILIIASTTANASKIIALNGGE